MSIDLIISSPLSRALETAKIVNEDRNIPLIIDEAVTERNLGIYEGQPNEQEIFNEIRYYTKNVPVEKGEDAQIFTKRVFDFLDATIAKYKGNKETILIVTHGFYLRSIDWYFNGVPGENEEIKRFGNCQVDIYEVQENDNSKRL